MTPKLLVAAAVLFATSVKADNFEPDLSTAEAPLVLAAGTAITVPDTVDQGQKVTVSVTGSATGRLELWGPVTQTGAGTLLAEFPLTKGRADFTAGMPPGSYQLRFFDESGVLLSRAEIDVSMAPVSISMPRGLGKGNAFTINWRGPAQVGDKLQLFDPRTRRVVAEVDALGEPGVQMSTSMPAPQEMGAFELRYAMADGTVLRSIGVKVAPGEDWLRSPLGVSAGESFSVSWNGVARDGHVFRIVDAVSNQILSSTGPDGAGTGLVTGRLRAPGQPGSYRVQYANAQTGEIASDLPLDVD